MDDTVVAYTGSVAVAMPLVVGMVVQSRWSKQLKGIVALVACGLAGLGSVIFAGAELDDLKIVIPAVILASQAAYHTFWKPTGLVPLLEQATDFTIQLAQPEQPVTTADGTTI
jgi:hypothetical protein